MIASLSGKLKQKGLDRVVLEVGGVGYLVFVSSGTLAELPGEGEPVELLCHTHVREDALQLYGFLADQERQAFELLILVSGIGPRLALVTLSGMPHGQLLSAVAAGDAKRLQTIPGIGKRTAERVVVELKERCAKLAAIASLPAEHRGAAPPEEVVDALVNLGYKRPNAERAVSQAIERAAGERPPPEQLLRDALAVMREG